MRVAKPPALKLSEFLIIRRNADDTYAAMGRDACS